MRYFDGIATCWRGEREAAPSDANFVPAELDSLNRQTRPPNEIVIVDDASTDATAARLERFAAAAPVPVTIRRNERNIGYVDNFETALALTLGEILQPCDQ